MPTPLLSAQARIARPSPTLAITAKANALRAKGVDVISFGAGEPDFNTPDPIIEAAKQALDKGLTKYTPSVGLPALREAAAEKFRRENGFDAQPENIVVSCGAKHSVFNSLFVTVSPGDEVIVSTPLWMTYIDQIRLCGGVPVLVSTTPESGFVVDPAAIEAAVTPKTKAILVNSPGNPTGAVFPREVLRRIAEIADKHDLWIISDEIYERLTYGEEHVSMASFDPEIAARTITISGCSKTFSMTGWRIGFLAAPKEVVSAIGAFQDQVTSNPTSFAQAGAIAALKLPDEVVESMRKEFDERRRMALDLLRSIPGLKVPEPKGAFYFFVDASAFYGGDDVRMAEALLEEANVALAPGSVFEGPGCLRLSYTASKEDLRRGIERIGALMSEWM